MSAVKALQQWCRVQVQGYRDVSITNMTTSFRDGLAFCALIHKHRPDLMNFDSLKKENVYENNKLAFSVAEEELGIPALLDAEDMVALQVPDRLSILTYVSQYYNYFHGRSPIGGMGGIKRPAEGPAEELSGKKNQPVASRAFPSSQPTGQNSPLPPNNTPRPPPSPKHPRSAKQDVLVEKSNQMGTLSNKCVSCNKHVHLVQRHLVDGRLYHRSCAKSLAPVSKCPPLNPTPPREPSSASIDTASRLGPTWLKDKPRTPPSLSSTLFTPSPPPSRPPSALSSAANDSFASKPATSPSTAGSSFTTTAPAAGPTPAPRTSITAAKTLRSKIQFLQSDDTAAADATKAGSGTGTVVHATAGQPVTITVNVGKKDVSLKPVEDKTKASGSGGGSKHASESSNESSKVKAAAFISKKLAENNNKPSWTNVVLKKPQSEKPPQAETPKREKEGVGGRVKLKVDPSLLADLQNPEEPGPVPVTRKLPGPAKPGSMLPNSSAAQHESPLDWRSKLKPVSKETKAPSPSSPKLSGNGPATPQTSEPARPRPPPGISVTPPATKGSLNGQQGRPGPDGEPKISKKKPDYIPKEDILKELDEIEENLTKLEKKGVELEMRLRRCEEDGEDDSFMDELMVEWFNLIRNKQVAMRRESELVYIGKTQDLEEQQPSVEQELRRLMEKPKHLKTRWDDKREEQLMKKLMEIVNDRNAIVEGLDEDRLREEKEDEQLNKMMKDFSVKKEKPKKKSPMSKLFNWGGKKETP